MCGALDRIEKAKTGRKEQNKHLCRHGIQIPCRRTLPLGVMQGVTTWETTPHVETQAKEARKKMRRHGQPLAHVAASKGNDRDDSGSHLYESPEHEPSSIQPNETCDDMGFTMPMSPQVKTRPNNEGFRSPRKPKAIKPCMEGRNRG